MIHSSNLLFSYIISHHITILPIVIQISTDISILQKLAKPNNKWWSYRVHNFGFINHTKIIYICLKVKLLSFQKFLVTFSEIFADICKNYKQQFTIITVLLIPNVLCNETIVSYILWDYEELTDSQQKVLTDVCSFCEKYAKH